MSAFTRTHLLPLVGAPLLACTLLLPGACARSREPRVFGSPDDAANGLIQAVKSGKLDEVIAIFGRDGKELIDSSDPASARRNQQVFLVATSERWRLEQQGENGRVLVVGHEGWPFPVPIVKGAQGWHFDTAAGKEEIIARRIGRNELAAIRLCRTYVAAQRLYAQKGHDGRPAGLFAAAFRSEPGRENGLYWAAGRGQKRSPLGDLVASAAQDRRGSGQNGAKPSPFHGYYFKILTAQGADAPGGAMDYIVGGQLSRGFALIAWPAQYDVTGVMTFMVSHDGSVREKDLGADTASVAERTGTFNPDASWTVTP